MVAAGPIQLRLVSFVTAERRGVLEMFRSEVAAAHGLG